MIIVLLALIFKGTAGGVSRLYHMVKPGIPEFWTPNFMLRSMPNFKLRLINIKEIGAFYA